VQGLDRIHQRKLDQDSPPLPKLVLRHASLVCRLAVEKDFYDTFIGDNVELVTEGIERFTLDGIRTIGGIERKFDLIVLRCGFKPPEFLFPFHEIRRNGVTLNQTWQKDGVRSYLSLVILGYPNLFVLYGPSHQSRDGPSSHSWSEIRRHYAIASIVWKLNSLSLTSIANGSIQPIKSSFESLKSMATL